MAQTSTSPTTPASPPRRSVIFRFWRALAGIFPFTSTADRIRSGRNLSIAFAGLFFLTFMAYHSYISRAFKTIGLEAAPAIVLTEQLRSALAGANASAMQAAASSSPEREAELSAAQKLLGDARQIAIAASASSAEKSKERALLEKIVQALGSYDQALGAAQATGFGYKSMSVANEIMQGQILPAASEIDQIHYDRMLAAYEAHKSNTIATALPAALLALGLAWALVWTQLEIFLVSNRIFNKGYLLASVAFLGFFLICAFSTIAAENALNVARNDAFESIRPLWQARSAAEEARSERAALLLASGNPAETLAKAKAWGASSTKISPLNTEGLRAAISDKGYSESGSGRAFGGLLGKLFANITFAGERDALLAMGLGWSYYADLSPAEIERNTTKKIEANSVQGAVILGNAARFDEFKNGLQAALNINQKIFDQEISIALARLALLPWLAMGMIACVILGCYFGAKERLDEYRF